MNLNYMDRYYQWLCDLVGINGPRKSYFLLAQDLWNRHFEWFVPNDDNRCEDGKQLREDFQYEEGQSLALPESFFEKPCTVFEVLIGVAIRCEVQTSGEDYALSVEEWFWKLIENLRLDLYDDGQYYSLHGPMHIDRILTVFIERTYHRNGQGGLFPLKRHKKDQRKVEIWYQMNAYMLENYYVDGANM